MYNYNIHFISVYFRALIEKVFSRRKHQQAESYPNIKAMAAPCRDYLQAAALSKPSLNDDSQNATPM
jgi:hypothetical protein